VASKHLDTVERKNRSFIVETELKK